jgi:hypothetical protein
VDAQPIASPVRYSADVETIPEDEGETTRGLIETLGKISQTTYKDGGHAMRAVHAKTHGILQAELEVLEDLPPVLAQGLFARPGRFPAIMRFSTLPGDLLDDRVSTPRGLALKVIGVEGERLAGSEGDVTQDFVMVNGPAFGAAEPKAFLSTLRLLEPTTDKLDGVKAAVSATLRVAEQVIEAFGGKSPTLIGLGGQAETHILGDIFYSQVPLRFGDYIAKISIAPVSPELCALTNAPLDLDTAPNGLREAVSAFFAGGGGEWEVRVQLCNDLETMPIEDAHIVWSEDKSPYLAVARLRAKPQTSFSPARAQMVDDGMMFSPWHGLAAHRPLGGVMRVRRAAYEAGARFRGARNSGNVAEPRGYSPLPG